MAALKDTTDLISELTTKLTELDNKVAAYRLDMAAEFTKHSEELLRDVPSDMAYRVSQAITKSLTNYPSLYQPALLVTGPSPASPTSPRELQHGRQVSPPPVLPHTSGSPKNVALPSGQPRGPHDRDLELHGLFTPSYLPLLETVDRPQHLAPASPGSVPSPTGSAPASLGAAPSSSDPATTEAATVDRQHLPERATSSDPSHHRRRPSPLRRGTNASIDSTVSDTSSVRTVKSALRRLSGSSRGPDSPRDPRRVRFDFEGQQVLPSSSPQTFPTAPPEIDDTIGPSPLAEDEIYATLGDVQGEEDEDEDQSGPPKKVSSTQALRALSKAPLDEGTVWTIVNTGSTSETSSSSDTDKVRRNTATNSKSNLGAYEETMDPHNSFGRPKRETYDSTRRETESEDESGPGQPINVHIQRARQAFDEEEDSDDEANALFMGSKKSGQKPALPVSSKAASRKTAASTAHFDAPAASPKTIPGNDEKKAPAFSPVPTQAGAPGGPFVNARPQSIDSPNAFMAGDSKQITGTVDDMSSGSSTSSTSSDNDLQLLGLRERSKKYAPGAHAAEDDSTVFEMEGDDTETGTNYLKDRSELRAERREKRIQKRLERARKYDGNLPTEMTDEDGEVGNLSTAETRVPGDEVHHSPPVQIGQSSSYRPKTPEFKVPNKVPKGHPGGYPASTSIGTFDGKPITPHVVKNKALRDQLKNTEGDVPFFVGSVNGNSGVDASNVKSYQASVMNPSTPNGGFASGSFAERLMWEKATGFNYGSDEERWGVKNPVPKAERKPAYGVSYGSPGEGSKLKRVKSDYNEFGVKAEVMPGKKPGDVSYGSLGEGSKVKRGNKSAYNEFAVKDEKKPGQKPGDISFGSPGQGGMVMRGPKQRDDKPGTDDEYDGNSKPSDFRGKDGKNIFGR